MKLDVPKRVFDNSEEISAIQFQTPTGGRKRIGMKAGVMFAEMPLQLPSYTVATAPSAVTMGAGTMIYVTDGLAGDPTLAISDGADWLTASTNVAIAIA